MDAKEAVKEWISQGKEYQAGVLLFSVYGKNPVLKNLFAGRESRYKSKLEYELVKLAGLTPEEIGEIVVEETTDNIIQLIPVMPNSGIGDSEPSELTTICGVAIADVDLQPKEVRRVLCEYRDLYTQRALLHKQLGLIPEENSEENIAKRKEIRDEIVAVGFRCDVLYAAVKLFTESGTLPIEAELWPVQPEENKAQLPIDTEGLKKMKKGLQTSLAKDRNKLDYQQDTKADVANPMPDGPERIKIEQRIEKKQKLIEEISYKLVEIDN